MNYIYRAYKITDSVLRDEAFSTIELNKALKVAPEEEKALITKIVYGTLENSVRYDYYISLLCEKKPKGAIVSLIKVGLYLLYELDSVPSYAAIDECVKIAKKLSKGSLSGFVNATLRRAEKYNYPKPNDKIKRLSVEYSVPELIVKKLLFEYGEELTEKMPQRAENTDECVRVNARNISVGEFETLLKAQNIPYKKLSGNAFSMKLSDINGKIDKSCYTVQALASIISVDTLKIKPADEVLDVCAAPGGKAVYAAEKAKSVTACDVHPHRVALIQSYADRMNATNLTAMVKDGTKLDEKFVGRFDKIICDVPCSGSGVYMNRPDVLFGITEEKIAELNTLQSKILKTSSKYLKKGGELIYSTCSLFSEENDGVVGNFLDSNQDFECVPVEVDCESVKKELGVQLIPNLSGTIGFYMSKLRKL